VPERGDVVVGHPRDGDRRRERLVEDPHDVDRLEVVDRQAGHRDHAVALGLDEPLALQQADRLPQGRAAHAELPGQLDLRHPGARRDAALDDRRAQLVVELLQAPAGVVGHVSDPSSAQGSCGRNHLV
jgi:hypothetical protein